MVVETLFSHQGDPLAQLLEVLSAESGTHGDQGAALLHESVLVHDTLLSFSLFSSKWGDAGNPKILRSMHHGIMTLSEFIIPSRNRF